MELGTCAGGQKTRMIGLPGREISLKISSAMWIRCTNVTDGRTDTGRQQRPSLSIASPGKKCTTTTCQPRLRLGPCCGAYGAPTDPIVGGQGACCPLPRTATPLSAVRASLRHPQFFWHPKFRFSINMPGPSARRGSVVRARRCRRPTLRVVEKESEAC